MSEMKLGQLAGEQDRFCPFAAVNKYPYKHLHGDISDKVSHKYFALGEFRSRGWTIYYLRTLLDPSPKPLLLIPRSEVEALFIEIYETLGIYVDFPEVWSHPGFDIGFTEEGIPRPRYLGRLTNDCSLADLEAMIPAAGEATEQSQEVDDRSFPAFRRKMEAAILAGKNKSKTAREKKRRDRVAAKGAWCAQLKRTQCYLALRPRGTVKKDYFHADPNLTWEQSKAAQAAYEEAAGIKLPKLVPTKPAPYHFHQNVVFVCVDVEAYEMDHKIITEIGISTLDTDDLVKNPPGEGGVEWMKKIRARHFRIAEYAHFTNSVHVVGCADNFVEKFGTSEWISIHNAAQIVASCFRHPYSEPGQYIPFPAEARMIGRYGFNNQLLSQYLQPISDNQQKRNVILVGHDIKSDIAYLRTIGYDVTNTPNLLEAVDTIDLFKAMKHEHNTPSLGAVLLEVELAGWHLHNAGNDAGYTMEALIGICFAALTTAPKAIADPEKLDAVAAEAQARLIEDIEEWEIADEEGGDGGSAIPVPGVSEMRDRQTFEQGMRRGQKAEERAQKKYSNDKRKGSRGSAYLEEFPPLKASVESKGETKFHAANEKTVREMAANGTKRQNDYVPPHLRGGATQAKPRKEEDLSESGTDEAGGGVKLPEKTIKRLALLDEDDDHFTI